MQNTHGKQMAANIAIPVAGAVPISIPAVPAPANVPLVAVWRDKAKVLQPVLYSRGKFNAVPKERNDVLPHDVALAWSPPEGVELDSYVRICARYGVRLFPTHFQMRYRVHDNMVHIRIVIPNGENDGGMFSSAHQVRLPAVASSRTWSSEQIHVEGPATLLPAWQGYCAGTMKVDLFLPPQFTKEARAAAQAAANARQLEAAVRFRPLEQQRVPQQQQQLRQLTVHAACLFAEASIHRGDECPVGLVALGTLDTLYVAPCGHVTSAEAGQPATCPLCFTPVSWTRVKRTDLNL